MGSSVKPVKVGSSDYTGDDPEKYAANVKITFFDENVADHGFNSTLRAEKELRAVLGVTSAVLKTSRITYISLTSTDLGRGLVGCAEPAIAHAGVANAGLRDASLLRAAKVGRARE